MEVDSQMSSSSAGPTQIPDHIYTVVVENNLVAPMAYHTVGGAPEIFRVGQTVQYSSPDGKVRIVFPRRSPYPVKQVKDSKLHTLMRDGKFRFHCFVTPHGSTVEIGWDKIKNPKAGGEHDVKT
jgi:hypothetical protein